MTNLLPVKLSYLWMLICASLLMVYSRDAMEMTTEQLYLAIGILNLMVLNWLYQADSLTECHQLSWMWPVLLLVILSAMAFVMRDMPTLVKVVAMISIGAAIRDMGSRTVVRIKDKAGNFNEDIAVIIVMMLLGAIGIKESIPWLLFISAYLMATGVTNVIILHHHQPDSNSL